MDEIKAILMMIVMAALLFWMLKMLVRMLDEIFESVLIRIIGAACCAWLAAVYLQSRGWIHISPEMPFYVAYAVLIVVFFLILTP